MKRNYILLSLLAATPLMAEEFATSGEGKCYTFAQLAELTENVTVTEAGEYIVNDDLTLSPADSLVVNAGVILLADGVTLNLDGYTSIVASEGPVLFSSTDEEALPRGIRVGDSDAEFSAINADFQYVGIRYLSQKPIYLLGCRFNKVNTAGTSTAALSFSANSQDNLIAGCTFSQCESAAIGAALNNANGMTISGCTFFDNNTQNTNKPQVNLISGGDAPIIVENCAIVGTGRTMVGGIGFMNYMNPGENKIVLSGNTISSCRYGMCAYSSSPLDIDMHDNRIINNCYESNPNNGGSGISLYDMSQNSLFFRGYNNYLEGNLWGVTVLGKPAYVNFGYLGDDESIEQFMGNNTFVNNCNSDIDYEFFDNTSNDLTIYAQGNVWGYGSQDSIRVAELVWDSNDVGGHGEVIFAAPKTDVPVVALPSVEASRTSLVDIYSLDGTREAIRRMGSEEAFSQLLSRRGMHILRDDEGRGRIVTVK